MDVAAQAAQQAIPEPAEAGKVTPPTQAAAELAKQSAGEEAPAPASAAPVQDAAEADAEADDDLEPKPVNLRALTVKDFQEAMKQVGSSSHPSMHCPTHTSMRADIRILSKEKVLPLDIRTRSFS